MSESTFVDHREHASKPEAQPLEGWARRVVRRRLQRLKAGRLTLVEAGGQHQYGPEDAALQATIFVRDRSFYRLLATRGAMGGAEAFMDAAWATDDLSTVIRILALDVDTKSRLDEGLARWARPGLALYHRLRDNSRAGSKRNISRHYDLGNDFFGLFLDPTLTYSSGIFESETASMEEASIAKYERICRKLGLEREDHLLEIGTGWGGFAIHAARTYGCRVTTTTISRRQHEVATQRVAEAGLAERVQVLLRDYRDLEGEYDKLVSIEMIEAVGHRYLGDFFRTCSERLRPDGVMCLQAITINEQDLEAHYRSVDFIKRYIFPGGELVSIGAINAAAARETDLRMTHVEDLTPHYAETLRRWRAQMKANLTQIRALGLGERFLRMWEFYLCYCEGGFEERKIGLVHAVYEKPQVRRASLAGAITSPVSS